MTPDPVQADLDHIRAVLGDGANLHSPRLDAYYDICRDWTRKRRASTGKTMEPPATIRRAIWADICANERGFT